ncbi:MAG: hypothetical protein JRI68_09410 [Deltaproteobacteria bacterium]|nr:hypothetical protein [Deltaproteobacteria bacterium]
MGRRILLAVALVVALVATSTVAAARVVEGDPFVEPVPLAGTWHYLDEDISPAEAAAADLSTWTTMELPGRRQAGDAGPISWYGLDVQLPPRGQWPEPAPEVVVAPPFFLFAYEVYVRGRLIGTSGSTPPSPRWGPLRHRWFAIPRDALPTEGPLALRLRVWGGTTPFRGTGLRCTSEAILFGKTKHVRIAVDLANERQRSSRPWQPYLAGAFVVLALVFAAFGLLVRREPGLLWLTIGLASLAGLQALDIDIGTLDDPLRAAHIKNVAGGVVALAVLLFFRRVLEIDTKTAKAMTWAAGALLGARLVQSALTLDATLLSWLGGGFLLVVGGYMLVAAVGKARSGQPDARVLVLGFVVAAVTGALEPAAGIAAVYGHLPWRFVVFAWAGSDVGLGLLALTMAFVVARRYARSLTDLQASFAASRRFVPQRFLTLLGRVELTEVRRADAIEREMAVLFADIRGFTTRSEAAGAASTFALVNRYLEAIEPAIHEHDGFINKFLGDGILALFPDPKSAVAGARALQQAVATLNQALAEEDEEPLRVGIGLHFGTVMLGTVGGRQQLDTTVIADVVNTASRVESLTKRYGVDILATQAVLDELAAEDRTRELDRVVVAGRKAPVTLHQIYGSDEPSLADRDEAYAKALASYRRGELTAALESFKALAESDPPSAHLAAQTRRLIAGGPPDDWNGTTRLAEK